MHLEKNVRLNNIVKDIVMLGEIAQRHSLEPPICTKTHWYWQIVQFEGLAHLDVGNR